MTQTPALKALESVQIFDGIKNLTESLASSGWDKSSPEAVFGIYAYPHIDTIRTVLAEHDKLVRNLKLIYDDVFFMIERGILPKSILCDVIYKETAETLAEIDLMKGKQDD